ncbi:alpha/beta fold hydrolase [Actinomadura sp. 6K520]|uniref:alpha/beta fold hydrolase n=1 Tax=Actinomadura sp. 6K520 TaxID=2530364 RepID=UPI0010483D8A|nr:alpha/beta fold hydrolase [Actinomadura sp. 6K520]TDE18973.1 alpha/beta hydrolase [Actinomadura sp. 6K520]
MILSPRGLRAATVNLVQLAMYGHVADLRPMPAELVDDGPRRSVYRYRPPEGVVPAGPPVLFVPPPGAPARCYDLRRGCSLAEHVVRAGRLSYLLDYGPVRCSDREPELAEWVADVLPGAIRAVHRDAGGQPVQLVGWCLGGVLSLLTAAAGPGLPIASAAVIAAPVAPGAARPAATLRPLLGLTRGAEADVLGFMLGGAPLPLAKRAYRVAGIDRYMLRPCKILTHLDNADFLAQAEAVDHFTDEMSSYPGRVARRIYRTLSRDDALLRGGIEIGGRKVDLGDVRVPVLAIAGRGDALAPVRAVLPLIRLLGGAPQVRFEIATGGHLGVLTGHTARTTTWRHLDRWLDEGTVRHGIRPQRFTVPV